ncbi:MAG TPA: MurR/RpiR family transcriptional regulator [Burkholderiaceae bacterium]|nr:MurR/RpiR family transcriptional regulator [Burkholderiaceae bacterium]
MAKKPHAPHTLEELVDQVRARFPDMSPQFQIAARHLIDFPEQVPVQSMRRLAADAGVQPATMVRLAKSLGYEGWEMLRQVFLQGLHPTPRRYAEQARDTIRRGRARSVLSRHVMAQNVSLQRLEELNADLLPDAARVLSRARHVHIAGFRASHAAAHLLHYLYRLFRNSVTLIRGDAGLLEMELRALEPTDAVVVVGFAPYSQEVLRVAQAARARGCAIVALCDSQVAPFAQHAAATLLFSTQTPSFFPSSAAAIVLAEALAGQLLGRAGRTAIDALDRAEDELRSTGAYLDLPPATTGRE